MTKATRKTTTKARALKASTSQVKRAPAELPVYDLNSWLDGYEAGSSGRPNNPAKKLHPRMSCKTDLPAWQAGYAEGYAHLRMGEAMHGVRRTNGVDAVNGSEHQGVGNVSWCNGFRAGIALAARQRWAS
jgi:hypothetical protein